MAGRALFAVAVGGLVICSVVGCSGGGTRSAAPSPTYRTTTGTQLPPIYPGTTVPPLPSTTTSQTSPTSTSVSATPGAARTLPGDGTFRMGEDLQPGTYRSSGGDSCSWERLRGLSGTSRDVIEHGEGTEPQVVRILPSDAAFKTKHCGDWTPQSSGALTSATTPVSLPPGANTCPTSDEPVSGLTHAAVGSTATTCAFAERVRQAYGAGGPPTSAPRQVYAESPVTGQQYSMTCIPNGSLVVCNGGNDAVVYLY
ncbi:hypothetical protein [Mycobacterium intermedium]|uniref:hypothetical protein n=1 Tax=Mycobacterium intermedium TaxID=28445 RepID=UPI000A41BA3C|nr:hypothetical protein [Mycobacterium intermedium]